LRAEDRGLLLSRNLDASETEHRWRAVIALSVAQLVAWGALYYAYAVLSAPIAAGLGLSAATVGAAFSFGLVVSGVAAFSVGRALDRHGARPVLLAGTLTGAAALTGIAVAGDTVSLVAACGLLGLAHAAALYDPAIRAIVDWFPSPGERGRALLVLTCVGGFASTVFLPVTAWLVRDIGWRAALLALAGGVVVVGMATAGALPSRPVPSQAVEPPPPIATPGRGLGLVAVAFALQSFAATGVSLALVRFLVAGGWEIVEAAGVAGLVGAAQVPGRLGLAPLQRLVPSHVRVPVSFVAQASAIVALGVGSKAGVTAAALAVGLTGGTMTIERATVLCDWFGTARFGARSGRVAFLGAMGRASAPFAVEVLRGAWGFSATFRLLAVALVAGAASLFVAGRTASRA